MVSYPFFEIDVRSVFGAHTKKHGYLWASLAGKVLWILRRNFGKNESTFGVDRLFHNLERKNNFAEQPIDDIHNLTSFL